MSKITAVFIVVFIWNSHSMSAQDGLLDTTFGVAGIVQPVFSSLESENHYLIVQPDGKIITGETVSQHGGDAQFYLIRYHLDGSRDTAFGDDGVVISDFPGFTSRLNAIVIQSDGKIIAAGAVYGIGDYYTRSVLARYNADGSLDSGFGNNGTIIKNQTTINSLILQADGKIILAENSYTDDLGWVNNLIRYHSDGIFDTDFGANGSVTTPFRGKIALQSDGKIVFSKDILSDESLDNNFVFMRYLNDGTPDPSFGTNGTATVDVENNDRLLSLKIQPDGKILFIGYSWHSIENTVYYSYYELIRLLPDGNLDTDFGITGIEKLLINPKALELQSDGKIIVAGVTLPLQDGPNQIALSRYSGIGALDDTFGNNGIVTTSLGESVRVGTSSVTLQPDGKIVVGGTFCEAYLSCHPHSFMSRYHSVILSETELTTPKNTFLAYPNPVNEVVTLDFNLNQSEVLSVNLYDSNGRKIACLRNETGFQTGRHSERLELPGTLSKGVYFLTVLKGNTVSSIRIVK